MNERSNEVIDINHEVQRIISSLKLDSDGNCKIDSLGTEVQGEVAKRSQLLKQTIGTLAHNSDDGGNVASTLLDLRDYVEGLTPHNIDINMSGVRRLVAKIPGVGTPVKRYFAKFQSSSKVIEDIVHSLRCGSDRLHRDNIILANDQDMFKQLDRKLEQSIVIGQLVDDQLSKRMETIDKSDPQYKHIEQEWVFPLRQRIMDLQQHRAVTQQSILTIEVIIRNNKELIRGVNRALNVTIGALNTAVTLSLALANQRIVLDKVNAVNVTTNAMIAHNAQLLRTQGVDVQKQAVSLMLDMEVLKGAFVDITAALDDIDNFKSESLPKMRQSILQLEQFNVATAGRVKSLIDGRQVSVESVCLTG